MNLPLPRGDALVLVAHPDDETIWMGGTILSHPELRWTIFSLCRSDDPGRAPKFKRACRLYGAKALISDLEDEGVMTIKESVPRIEHRIKKLLTPRRFTYLFTHGYNGEYNHPRHKGVHLAAKRLLRKNIVHAYQVFTFAYHPDRRGKLARPRHDAAFLVVLDRRTLEIKRHIIGDIYGFHKRSFEYRSAGRSEAFTPL